MKKKTVKKVTTVIAVSAVAASTMITPAIAAGQSAADDEDGKQQNQQQSKGKAAASNIKEAKIQLEAAKEANQKTAAEAKQAKADYEEAKKQEAEALETAQKAIDNAEQAKANARNTFSEAVTNASNENVEATKKMNQLQANKQEAELTAAQIEVDKKQAAYDEIKAMIMQLLHAQADYNQKQQEEVTAKTEYKNAQNIVNTLEAALADAKDTQAEAQSKEERAKALSYDTAFLNQITDPDFTYLNDEISKVKDAQSREALLQKAYDAAKQKAAESEEAYGQAKLENVRTLAELAVAGVAGMIAALAQKIKRREQD